MRKRTLDKPLLIILLLMAVTVSGWTGGFLVWPFGLFILLILFMARLMHLYGKEN